MDTDYKDIFTPGGPLARALPHYAYRPEQALMAKAVGAALARLEPLIVEAGTGTGKTFAYLIPALLSGRSVIISTGTRTLQDQLFRRDVPMLAKALGLPVKIALLKGRTNYLCRHRLDLATQQGSLLAPERHVARLLARVSRWAATTKTGDLAELTDLPEQSPVWPSITSTRENCLGQECAQFSRCHVFDARRNAQAADIVVVNHHLLLADLALKDEGFGDLLPGAEAVILDEAHQVPDIAAQFFGQSWSVRQVQVLMRDITAELAAAAIRAPALVEAVLAVDGHLDELRFALNRAAGRYEWAELSDAFLDALPEIETALSALGGQLEGLGGGAGTANCARRAAHLANALASLRELSEEAGLRWVEVGANGLTLQFTPFEIAERLREYVESRPCAWIFTSATLAIATDFSHFAERIGLPDARTLCINSPFDYRDQARLFLKARFPNPPFPVLVQGEAPREALLNRFRDLGNAVLLATGSFWEGVDVKGDALSIVAIDKLPFAAPDDPLLKARLEGIRRRGGNPFFEYQLPQAVLALKQGVGRLIRDFDDFGVIVLGDPRLKTKAYGRVFLESMPPSPVVSDVAVAAEFLRDRLRQRPASVPAVQAT